MAAILGFTRCRVSARTDDTGSGAHTITLTDLEVPIKALHCNHLEKLSASKYSNHSY